MLPCIYHACPLEPCVFCRWRTFHIQALTYYIGKVLLLHGKWNLIQNIHVKILYNVSARHVTEQSDLILDALIKRKIGTTYEDIGLNTHSLKILNARLGRLGLDLT